MLCCYVVLVCFVLCWCWSCCWCAFCASTMSTRWNPTDRPIDRRRFPRTVSALRSSSAEVFFRVDWTVCVFSSLPLPRFRSFRVFFYIALHVQEQRARLFLLHNFTSNIGADFSRLTQSSSQSSSSTPSSFTNTKPDTFPLGTRVVLAILQFCRLVIRQRVLCASVFSFSSIHIPKNGS